MILILSVREGQSIACYHFLCLDDNDTIQVMHISAISSCVRIISKLNYCEIIPTHHAKCKCVGENQSYILKD